MSEWISVNERLPAKGVAVLVALNPGTMGRAHDVLIDVDQLHSGDGPASWIGYYMHDISHWMPLPSHPAAEPAREESKP